MSAPAAQPLILGADPYAYLRMCAGCAGSFATYAPGHWDDPYTCPNCLAKQPPFNPQPNDVVHLADNWRTQFVVLARTGDTLTIRRLGWPDGPISTVHVANTMPTAGGGR